MNAVRAGLGRTWENRSAPTSVTASRGSRRRSAERPTKPCVGEPATARPWAAEQLCRGEIPKPADAREWLCPEARR
ncbi:hypothetical protein GCM10010300_75370 [Streptomyces olivaceoviridis]|uniref:hypothetical protein n=1 Tax=Streptomyces olivaceoviridis TaxID=1921 RepID=UPI0016765B66|nr:hypothetical protein [Streptomyces olivaceoviridis]GGZ20361.1 hypothetical protein GCM10010300_75370 [Streptomyces olivaceoviridis]